MKALMYLSLLFLKLAFLPNLTLLGVMGFLIAFDFLTGVAKAIVTGKQRTSEGFKKSVIKFLQYGGAIVVSMLLTILSNVLHQETSPLLQLLFGNALIVLIIYIEITSVFENLYACDQKSVFSRNFIRPVLKVLTAQIKGNPAVQAAENLKEQKVA